MPSIDLSHELQTHISKSLWAIPVFCKYIKNSTYSKLILLCTSLPIFVLRVPPSPSHTFKTNVIFNFQFSPNFPQQALLHPPHLNAAVLTQYGYYIESWLSTTHHFTYYTIRLSSFSIPPKC